MRLLSYREERAHSWNGAVLLNDGPHALDATVRQFLQMPASRRDEVAALAAERPALNLADEQIGPPVPDAGKIFCLGINYLSHADEVEMAIAEAPTVFTKFANTLVGPRTPIRLPAAAPSQVDYEVEVALVIGRTCRRTSADHALEAVAGFMVLNDVSARDLQLQTSQWTMGKTVDGFAPCGPCLVSTDEVADFDSLHLRTRVNGEERQSARAGQMIFKPAETIAFISSLVTLEIGDIIATGTPAGVGMSFDPPCYLRPGDVVETEVEGIGVLVNEVRAEAG
ncbi:MAG: fumarylacetoacetate hydrolase family protein [Solirubrobacterales bacterium]